MNRPRALARVALLFGLGALAVAAWASRERAAPDAAAAPACTCAAELLRNGWCEACGEGYVAERRIPSRALYDALDAHGHDIDAAGLPCSTCREAVQADGFCAAHQRGFVGGRAYLSRLAYHLARHEPAAVQAELAGLDRALAVLAHCELCAAAMVVGGTCPKCRISYAAKR